MKRNARKCVHIHVCLNCLNYSLRLVQMLNGYLLRGVSLRFRSIVVSGVKAVSAMAVDWISKNLYWVDREKVRNVLLFWLV